MANVLASKIRDVKNLREVLRNDPHEGARQLLGMNLVRGEMKAEIVETESYTWDDPGCHSFGKAKMKNMAMFGPPGTAYIYFTYGNHWMLNVVAHPEQVASAVLIRAAKPLAGLDQVFANRPGIVRERDLLSGPGKLAKGFGIDSTFNGIDLLSIQSELHVEPTDTVVVVGSSQRIGLAIGKGDDLTRRFVNVNEQQYITNHRHNKTILWDKRCD